MGPHGAGVEQSIDSHRQKQNRRVAQAAILITLLLLITPGAMIAALMQSLEPGLLAVRQWVSGWWPWSSPTAGSEALQIDKLVHFLMFAVCGALVARAWASGSSWALPLLGLIAFGALTELVQYLVPGRSMSFNDFVADAAGAAAGFLVWYALPRKKATP